MRLKTVRMFSIIFSYIKVKRVSSRVHCRSGFKTRNINTIKVNYSNKMVKTYNGIGVGFQLVIIGNW